MSKRTIENAARIAALEKLKAWLEEEYGEVYKVPAMKSGTVNSYGYACPIVDKDGNELVLKFEVTVPRGARGTKSGYDPYTESENFLTDIGEKKEGENGEYPI